MRIGISSLIGEIEECLKICEQNNLIDHIEVGVDSIDDCLKLLNYKNRIKNLKLSIGIHMPMELNLCEEISEIRNAWVSFFENIENSLRPLDICYYNLHLGYSITGRLKKYKSKFLDNAIDSFKNLDIKTDITIENTYSKGGDISNIGTISSDFEYIFRGAKREGLFFCYDTGHNLINKSDYTDKLLNRIKVVHLSDNNGIDDLHLGICSGILDEIEIHKIIKMEPEFIVFEVTKEYVEDSIESFSYLISKI